MSKIPELKLSKKGNELVNFYKLMVGDGYKNDNFNPGGLRNFLKIVLMNIILKQF